MDVIEDEDLTHMKHTTHFKSDSEACLLTLKVMFEDDSYQFTGPGSLDIVGIWLHFTFIL